MIDLGQTIDCFFIKCNSEGLDPSIDTTSWLWNGNWIYPVGLPVTITADATGWDITFAGHTGHFDTSQLSVKTLIDGYGNPFTLLQRLTPDFAGLFEIGVVQGNIPGCCVTPGVPEPGTWALMLLGLGLLAGWRRLRRA